MTKVQKRTDVHRAGAIVPADYDYVMSYSLPTAADGVMMPAYNVNCIRDKGYWPVDALGKRSSTFVEGTHGDTGRCCLVGLGSIAKVDFADHGGTGSCSICGAHFVYGDVWVHKATKEHIHVGHTCSDKYSMLADRSAFELERGRAMAAAAVAIVREEKREAREAFLCAHDNLEADLQVEHRIIADIRERFVKTATLSEKQVALVRKLAHEVRNPKPAEVHVPAPQGRVTFEGTVVSMKVAESYYGDTLKLVVKMTTEQGTWLCYVTKPATWAFPEGWDTRNANVERGDVVELTATLKPGRDPHFAIGKRPTCARLVSRPPAV